MELAPTKASPPQELAPPPAAQADQEHARSQSPRPQREERKDEQVEAEVEEDDQRDECRTPISIESKLPSIASTCPPAPKKTRSASGGVIGCKRRLSESDLFEVSAQEMERLFRRRDDQPTTASAVSLKKRKWSSF